MLVMHLMIHRLCLSSACMAHRGKVKRVVVVGSHVVVVVVDLQLAMIDGFPDSRQSSTFPAIRGRSRSRRRSVWGSCIGRHPFGGWRCTLRREQHKFASEWLRS
jgi:hypothetical protein